MILDGILIPVDRVAADRPFYSGKHKKHGMNLQVIASPDGGILWVSRALSGLVHDKKAEWIWGVLVELEAAGLVTLADKGYQGSSYAKIAYGGRTSPSRRNRPTRSSGHPASARTLSSRPGNPPKAPLLPLARRETRQGASRPPDTWFPGRNTVTFVPTASTYPAMSARSLAVPALDRDSPASTRTRCGEPRMKCRSKESTAAARTRTSTSWSPIAGMRG